MAFIGHPVVIRGDVDSHEDLTIDGYVAGAVWSDGQAVIVGVAAAFDN